MIGVKIKMTANKTQMLHVWYIFTYIWAIFWVNVGKYTIHGASGKESTLKTGLDPRKGHFSRKNYNVLGDFCAHDFLPIKVPQCDTRNQPKVLQYSTHPISLYLAMDFPLGTLKDRKSA